MFNIPLKTGSSSAITVLAEPAVGGVWCSLSGEANNAVTATIRWFLHRGELWGLF